MTLALYGKSRQRQWTLVLLAIVTLLAAIAGGASLQQQRASALPQAQQIDVIDYSQCANGVGAAVTCVDGWINGILNANNSHYGEDQATPQRAVWEVPAGGPATGRTVTFTYQTRKGGVHAYDSLTTWNLTATGADRCQGLDPADCVGGLAAVPTTFPVPLDLQVVCDLSGAGEATSANQLTGVLTMYGGTITGISAPAHSNPTGSCSGDEDATVTITYDVGVGTVASDTKVMLLLGGHTAASSGPRGWGPNLGSGSVSGGPYHIKWTGADGDSVGNRDNQIQSGAIAGTPNVNIAKADNVSSTVPAGGTFVWNITVTVSGATTTAAATVSDTLPTGFTVNGPITDTASGGGTDSSMTCTQPGVGGASFTCTLATGAPVGTYVIAVPTKAPANFPQTNCTSYNNTATVTGGGGTNIIPSATDAITVTACANPNVGIAKSNDAPGGVVPSGGTFNWIVTATVTQGPTVASATINDTLPAGFTGGTPTFSVGGGGTPGLLSCGAFVGQAVSCTLASGAANGTYIITIPVTAPVATAQQCAPTDHTNTATVSGGGGTNTPPSATNSVDIACPNVSVTKVAGTSPVNVGSPVQFTVTVTNNGPGVASNVVVSDTLSNKADWDISPAVAGCSISGTAFSNEVLTCTFATMAVGEVKTITLVGATRATPAPNSCGTIPNSVSITIGNEASGNTSDNSAGPVNVVVNCPVLGVVKSANPIGPVPVGSDIGFDIVVTNSGNAPATGVTVNDVLPTKAGLVYSATATTTFANPVTSSGTCGVAGNTLTCSGINLAVGQSVTIHVTATTSGATTTGICGVLTNTDATATVNGVTSTSGSASVTITCPDLSIVKTANPAGPVVAGELIGFDLTVSNAGPANATNVTVSDTLPTPAGVTWSTLSPGCVINVNVLTCSNQTVNVGVPLVIHVTGTTTALGAGRTCGVISNDNATATVLGQTDTSGSASVTVNCPNPAIDKTGNGPISAGDTVVYTIVVTAGGTGPQNVVLNDTMPGTGLSWTLGGPDASGCVPPPPGPIPSGSSITCTWNNLTPGNTRTISLSAVSNPTMCSTPLENRVSITSPGDVDTSNNTDSTSVVVNCPNVSLTKTADSTPVNAGEPIGFTVTASNSGPGVAKGFVVNDPLPGTGTNWSIQSQNPANSCAITGAVGSQVLRCPPAGTVDLAANASITVHIISPTTPLTCGLVSNTASVTGTNLPTPVPNATASVTVNCPNITVLKTADNGTISAGDQAAFTILVQNIGVGTAKGVTLNDTLPAGTTWSEDSSFCSIVAGALSCAFGDMAQNASHTIHVTGPTTAANCGVLTNTATVAATNESATAAADGNSSTARISVNCADISIVKTPDAPTVNATDPVGYTITVTNNGSGIARDVIVTDTLPTNAGLSWSETPDITACSITAGVLTCNFGDLAAGQSKNVHISSATTVGTCPAIDNLAGVTTSNDGSATSSSRIVVNCPNVTVVKSVPAGQANPVSAGAAISFQIVVSVTGQGTAYNVTTNDALPATTSGWSVTTNPLNPTTTLPACGIILNQLTCSFGNVAAGTTFTIVVSGNAIGANNQVTCDTITNTATVGAGNESNTTDNTSTATIGVNCPNIVIGKTTSTGIVSAGDVARYQVTVSNTGAGTATNVMVSDPLPAPTLSWTVNPPVPGCAIVASVLSCSGNAFASMTPNASIVINLEATTTPAVCGVLSNRAFASAANDTLPGEGQVQSDLVLITVQCPDVTVLKTADNSPISAGDTAAFTILVTSNGPGTARNVTLTDTLPAGTNWTDDHADCTIAAGVLSCNFGDMIDDATELVHVSGTTTPAQCGTLVNLATVAATNEAAAQQGNNSDGAEIVVLCPDVTVAKVAGDDTISAGDVASFTITVTNAGAGVARNVILNDPLPAGPAWTENSDQCSIVGGVLSCNFGDLAPGQSVSVTVSAPTTPAQCGSLVNVATVSASNEAAAQQGNNSSTATIVIDCPDVVIVKTPDAGTVSAGSPISFTISVTNIGAGTATGVTVTDTLPAGFSWSEDSDACTIVASVLTCNVGTLASGAPAFTVNVTAPTTAAQCAVITNTATVSATNEAAANTSNNTDSGQVTIQCPDVSVTKVASEDQIDPGEEAEFVITVTSNGPGTANDVTLTDTLPAGIAWTEDNANCSIAAGVLECDFGDMASGDSEDVTISGEVSIAQCGTLTNTATVSATNEPDTALANNTSTDSLVVACGTIQIIKIDQVGANNPSRPADGDWDFTVTGPNEFNEERAITFGSSTTTIVNVPLGNGYGATEAEAIAGACPVPNDSATYRTTSPAGTQNLTEPGQTITFTFTNVQCDVVLSTGLLVIEKVEDLNGNHVLDAGEVRLSSWPVTVTGPEFPGGQQFLTDANGRITLAGILTGTYTVTEGTNSGFTVIGVVTDDDAPVFTASTTTSTALAFQDTDTITFFNQPRGSITVHKIALTSHNGGLDQAAPNDDDGWVITVTSASCNINLQAITDANGNANFENLPICSDYIVSENPVNAGSPGFSPAGPASQSNVSPGVRSATAITFTNRRVTFDPPCPACNPVTTPTPTPTRTPTPTNTPTPVPSTATPTNTPTLVSTVVGERTPGPASPTPIAPRTGAGFGASPVSGANLLLVLIGLATIAGGLFFVGAGRRKSGNR